MPTCPVCDTEFEQRQLGHVYCSQRCRTTFNSKRRDQRSWVSGNWRRYLNRLATASKERKELTTEALLDILAEQRGRCALTGVKMTNTIVKDKKTWTNASVDRIVSGGPYSRDNVQLVCAAVNVFRSQMSVQEFREWCRLVSRFRGLPKRT